MLNEYYNNIGVKGFFQRYGIWNGIKRAAFVANPVHIVKDYEIKKVLWQKRASKQIKKYIKYKDINPEGLEFKCKSKIVDPVWVFWDSGIENAPDIVKACYETIKKYSGGTVIALDHGNVDNYVVFPAYIREKVRTEKISIAAYSDLLRFSLLEQYGGTWIDSTVYLSGSIPSMVIESDFFALRNTMMLVENPVLYAVWFIHAKAHNKTIREIRNVSFAYWKKEKHVIEYLLPNLIVTELVHDTETEERVPYLSTEYSEYLIKCLGQKYQREKVDWIFGLTNIHKLSYKLSPEISHYDSVYNYIVKKEL